MRSFGSRVLVIVPVLSLALSTPAIAELWYEHYQAGDEALKAQRWDEAARQFNAAIEKRGQSGVRVRTYGMNFISYHPYLKLGIAYYNLGQFDASLQAFDTEEGLGTIGQSADLKNLQAFRKLALEGKVAAASTRAEQIAGAIRRNLREASVLEQQDKLDEAMAAVGKGLALDVNDADARAAMERLRGIVANRERLRDIATQVAALVRESESLRSSGNYRDAAARLNQALALSPDDPSARGLLDDVQARLRDSLPADGRGGAPSELAATALADAARLETEGKIAEALQSLQTALAVDPDHREIRAMQARLVRAQSELDRRASRTEEVARLLNEGATYLRNGEPGRSIASFNRVIALDPGNASVQTYLGQAYSAMNAAILDAEGAPIATRLPPAIVIANAEDLPQEFDGAGPQFAGQVVSAADFTLSGLIMDDQPEIKVKYVVAAPDGGDSVISESPEVTLAGLKAGLFYQFRFRRDYVLDPGAATLKVVVTDMDGLGAEGIHQVRYDVPLWERTWFYPAVAAVFVLLLTVAGWNRTLRRSRLLKRRFNPYVAGAPVTQDDLFVGREPLLSRILQTIHNNSILLYGERRIGKTTLQHHLKKRLQKMQDPDYDFFPVYVDLQGTKQEEFFATMAVDVFEELAPILNGAPVQRENTGGAPYDYTHFIREIRRVINALREHSSKKIKLVLLIDEVDELNNYDPRINQRLRSLFMKSFAEDLVAVVSGVAIKKHWESEGSPWYNFFEEIEVKPFTRKDAEDLIERPIRGIFKLEDGVVELILNNTGCKPYLIQKICIALVSRLHDEKRRKITTADVEAIGRPAEA